jgi:hypothetical protein
MPIPRNTDILKRIVQQTFNTTCRVSRKTEVADSSGGMTDTYATVSTLACQFYRQGITPLERENAVQVRSISVWIFVFAWGSDVLPTDRLVEVSSGRTFEVVSSATGSLDLACRVLAQEIL